MRSLVIPALIGVVLYAATATAEAEQVDLQLILAADVSRSVDPDEFKLQREGYAAAFTNPKVLQAIAAGPYRSIAVTFVEWSGSEAQRVVADWTIVRDEETGGGFANILLTAPRSFAGFTSISAAIDFSMKHFQASGVESDRRVIDVSGDGTNNGGRPVNDARDEAVSAGVTINGLAIINQHPNPGYTAHTQPPEGPRRVLPAQCHRRAGIVRHRHRGFHHLLRGDRQQADQRDRRRRGAGADRGALRTTDSPSAH